MTIPKNTFLKIIYTAIIIGAGFFSEAYCQDVSTNQYKLTIKFIDKDSLFTGQELHLQTNFKSQLFCADYINKLPGILNTQGYLAASVDAVNFDSAAATIQLYLGLQQKWVKLNTDSIDKKALDESGFFSKNFTSKPFNPTQVQVLKERVLNYYEKSGYPFAAVYLDSIRLQDETINAILKVNSGPLYHIDSIRVNGKVKIASHFLQRYLGIVNGSIYNKDKLDQVEKKLMELPFLQEQQPSELQLLGTGAVLNLYLQPKPSSQLNFLIGFLPANNQTNKLQITGDVNLNLKNALGKAETILLNWQQLQIQSPRLNIGYQQPFIFKSAFGIDVAFNLFNKDFDLCPTLVNKTITFQIWQTETIFSSEESNDRFLPLVKNVDLKKNNNNNYFGRYFDFFKLLRCIIKMSEISFERMENSINRKLNSFGKHINILTLTYKLFT